MRRLNYTSRVQFSSVAQSCPTLCDPMSAALQASLSITNSWSFIYPEAILKGQQSTKINNIKDILKRELPIQSKFSSVQSLSRIRLFATAWIAARLQTVVDPSLWNSFPTSRSAYLFCSTFFFSNESHHLPQSIIIGFYILCEKNE